MLLINHMNYDFLLEKGFEGNSFSHQSHDRKAMIMLRLNQMMVYTEPLLEVAKVNLEARILSDGLYSWGIFAAKLVILSSCTVPGISYTRLNRTSNLITPNSPWCHDSNAPSFVIKHWRSYWSLTWPKSRCSRPNSSHLRKNWKYSRQFFFFAPRRAFSMKPFYPM